MLPRYLSFKSRNYIVIVNVFIKSIYQTKMQITTSANIYAENKSIEVLKIVGMLIIGFIKNFSGIKN